jgi:hypothetical protein
MKNISKNLYAPILFGAASLATTLHLVEHSVILKNDNFWFGTAAAFDFALYWFWIPLLLVLVSVANFVPTIASKIKFLGLLNFIAALVGTVFWLSSLVRINLIADTVSALINGSNPWAGLIAGSFLDAVATFAGVLFPVSLYFASKLYLKDKNLLARFKNSAVGGFYRQLIQSKLNEFLSRKIADIVFLVYAWLLVAGGMAIEIYAILLWVGDFDLFLLVGILVFPIVWSLVLIFTRMAFEAFVAVIAIAENTKKETPKKVAPKKIAPKK